MPYQNRGIHDLCQYQYHRKFLNPSLISPTAETECDDSQSSLSRAIECLHAKPFSNCTICKIDANTSSPTTTISCCGSCRSCSDLLNKILHLYAIFPSGSASTSIASSIFNVFPRSSRHSVLPSVVYKADSSNENDHQYADEVDGNAVGIDLTSTTGLRRLQYDSISSSDAFNQRRTSLVPLQKTEQQPVEKELSFSSRQRKKSIFNISEEETEQLQQLANEKTTSSSQTSKSDYISLSASSTESSVSTEEAKSVDHKVTTPQKSAKSSSSTEDEQDIVTIFRLASMEYYEKLNNIMAVSLMDTEPDEAMQCWSSCEASSRAFFNMGVAYESGRHAKRAKPDFVQAHDCYALAASMGHRDAIFNLALFYLYGDRNVEVNLDYGYKLLQAAAEKGVLAAKNFITEARRTQFIDDLRESLQKTQSRVDVLKRRPERTSQSYGRPSRPALRPTPSLIGPSRTQLKMKQSTAVGEGVLDDITASATLKRSTSSPNFLTLNNDSASRNAMATVQWDWHSHLFSNPNLTCILFILSFCRSIRHTLAFLELP